MLAWPIARYLIRALPVVVYPLEHFMQWGTPEDLAEYNDWSKTFRRLLELPPSKALPSTPPKGSSIIPMAGLGKRFADEGYRTIKPLIAVSGRPMVIQAMNDLPPAKDQVFVLRDGLPEYDKIVAQLESAYPNALIATTPKMTDGQACTALFGLKALEQRQRQDPGPHYLWGLRPCGLVRYEMVSIPGRLL